MELIANVGEKMPRQTKKATKYQTYEKGIKVLNEPAIVTNKLNPQRNIPVKKDTIAITPAAANRSPIVIDLSFIFVHLTVVYTDPSDCPSNCRSSNLPCSTATSQRQRSFASNHKK